MPVVKVWNRNVHPHVEDYKGDKISIPAGGFVEMEWEEAIQFKGQYTPIKFKGDGETHCPTGFKMIEVEQPATPVFRDQPLVNHATGERAATKGELAAMLAAFSEQNPGRVAQDADADKASDSRMAVLERELAELKALLGQQVAAQAEKRGPGRPSKGAT